MTTKELYNQIHTIYCNNDFKSKLLINDLFILSQDNIYLVLIGSDKTQFRVEIEYSYHSETKYKLVFQDGTLPYHRGMRSPETSYKESYDDVPDSFLEKILPILRDFKLNELL
jgi:hypothetical protein